MLTVPHLRNIFRKRDREATVLGATNNVPAAPSPDGLQLLTISEHNVIFLLYGLIDFRLLLFYIIIIMAIIRL